ncbi:uncharacterized protein [Bactrocera oleae]|uniref:uncharacterized protein isoform X2 n=1 Tax=Bactrocera oleae TaxID=104688 RepID=UPI00387E28DD
MWCTWKVLAVCLLLQSVYAYLPVNNESLNSKGAEILKENAATLFEAIFQPTQRKEPYLDDTIMQDVLQEICGDLLAGQIESTLYFGGFAIRQCMRVNDYLLEIYMQLHGVERIQQQFLEGIQRCSLHSSTSSEIKCYSHLISRLFRELYYVSLPYNEQNCVDNRLKQMMRILAKASAKYERCLSICSFNNPKPPPPPQWTPTWAPPQWTPTWAPPQWTPTWAPPQWTPTWAPPQWNSTLGPPNSTWAPPQWNSTLAPPNSTWAPPQWNSTLGPTDSTWSPPQWNSTLAPPNSTWAPPQWNSTWAPSNSTWAPPQWSSTLTPPNPTWAPPQWNSTLAPINSTWAPPQWNTTVGGNTTVVSINATESAPTSVTTESITDTISLPWYQRVWQKIENIF